MSNLQRSLAPISEGAWAAIDGEITAALVHFLAARKLVDFSGPHGWAHSAVDLGRVAPVGEVVNGVEANQRRILPLVELRATFELSRAELDAFDRGADDADLGPAVAAARDMALAEDALVFDGFAPGGIEGIIEASPHEPLTLDDDFDHYPNRVAAALAVLKGAGVGGPYAIAFGPRCYQGVIETTERGGYPLLQHLRLILGGPVIWAPSVDGAVVVSQRGGDFALTVGGDLSVGYQRHDEDSATLFIEESLTFRAAGPEAAVVLHYE